MKPGFLRHWTSAIEDQEPQETGEKKWDEPYDCSYLPIWESFQAMEESPATSIGKGDPGGI